MECPAFGNDVSDLTDLVVVVEEDLEEGVDEDELKLFIKVAARQLRCPGGWRAGAAVPSCWWRMQRRNSRARATTRLVPLKGSAEVKRWPARLQRKLAQAGEGAALRSSVEKTERNRWIQEQKRPLEEASSPATERSQIFKGEDFTRRFGKGRRASALRKHVRTWGKARDWLVATFRHPWPDHPDEFTMYFECRAGEPCGKTVPGNIYKTLLMIGGKAAVKNVLEELNHTLGSGNSSFTKKAWRLPVKVVMAMEDIVLGCSHQPYIRGYAWFRLVKLWAGVRFSDAQGMDHGTLEWQEKGLSAVLSRTKTTRRNVGSREARG